ncbi:23S rRNA (uracil(1939)-C(5))-methyltransferase RlmD [Cellvibrio zantedeschiae]|uniref:23S rRNA (uracil(1939)-C(5))-methyltransferase RlmD n=1 Tax=Cellvibrio zantedeschiae TaxID=1237077 RepID=A0ABQ3AR24_9GAMM|nr:23S rRNA (uracil(1939)-C(5))-methyltransferase RlmD [Cellvibrio zantedeschiae]GGY65083.1 23S rRNA (uracil(1939)-C(5))-methyltransferase RlmD [Cellvibrio zantedeschiae]
MSNPKGPKKPPSNKLGQKPRSAKTTDKKAAEKTFAFELENSPRLNKPRVEKKAQPMDDMRLGEFVIDRMSHDGRGITQWNGKTLFVDGALTGERISARLVRDHARYAEARLDKLLDAAPERVEAVCAHYAECGGCQLQHFHIEHQVSFKQAAVLQQLELWGGVKPKQLLPTIRSETSGYRRCARLGIDYTQGEVTLGFRKRNSKQLVQVDLCGVLAPELNRLLAPLKIWLTELRAAEAVTHLELIQAEQKTAVVLRHVQPLHEVDLQHLTTLSNQLNFSAWLQGGEAHQLQDVNGQDVDPRLTYSLANYALELDFHPQDFIQVNPDVNAQMVAQALQLLALKGDERVLDLFCGIGNFTLPLARKCAEVIGIEAVDSMVQRGRENASKMGITNVQFMAANLLTMTEHRLNQTCGKIDAVLLDPPRDGAKEIIDKLPQLSPKRIVYVSCNPATLARDAKVLVAAGYQLDSVGVLDMFPHTAHVESMALFVKR